ncbi:MAG: DUF547 domain-containing protein [Gammaproteobacteria bacterium]|nr:DUF547 domain-containing protein [Gammaproteobacteria bacterium]
MQRTLVLILLLLPAIGSNPQAAESADLWPRWSVHDAQNPARIDHRGWAVILRAYVYTDEDGIHRFAYGEFSEDDQERLDRYLVQMSQIKISDYNRKVQRAYWINLYNALTVREVLRAYPVDSIRDISAGLLSFGPWDKELIEVEGHALTLNDIEHRILRPVWRDARLHYALNCASLGCPNLRIRVFTGNSTERMLDRAAREFVNHARGARVFDGKLQVSSLYLWYIDDFGGDDAGVIRHLRLYAYGELASSLRKLTTIDNHSYDWRLNSLSGTDNAKRVRGRVGS